MGAFDNLDLKNLRRDVTLEPLVIPVDYDDDDVGSVGDPPVGTLFTTQIEIDNFLTDNGWTAFKHFQAVWDATPAIFNHAVTVNLASGIHRPRPSDTIIAWNLGKKVVLTSGTISLQGDSGFQELVSGLTVSVVGVDDNDPWIDFSGTPFAGKDVRGLKLILDTGQVSVIHKHTDSRLYFVNKISPAGPVSGVVGRPSTIIRNSQKVTNTTKHVSDTIVQITLDGDSDFVKIDNLTTEHLSAKWDIRVRNSSIMAWITNVIIDHATQKNDHGLVPNGRPIQIDTSFLIWYYCSIRGSFIAEVPSAGTDGLFHTFARGGLSLWYGYHGGGDDIIDFDSGSSLSIYNSVVDEIPGISFHDGSLFVSQGGFGLNNGVNSTFRDFSSHGIAFLTGSHEGEYSSRSYRFENQAGPCVIIDNYSYLIPDNGQIVDGGGNLDVGIEVRGSFCRAQLLAGTDITGALGDMRIDGVITAYTALPTKAAPFISTNVNAISKEV